MKPNRRGKAYWVVYWTLFTTVLVSIVIIMWNAQPMEMM